MSLNRISTPRSDKQHRPQSQSGSPDKKNTHNVISLLNFNQSSRAKDFINSPRSVEALKRLGFEDYELLIRTKEDFLHLPVPPEFAHEKAYYYEVKTEHYEKRRKEKLKLAIEEREEVILAQSQGDYSVNHKITNGTSHDRFSEYGFSELSYMNSNDNEKRKIQQMKNQQRKEIEFIIQTEIRNQEIKRRNDEKILRMQEIEHRRAIEMEKKHQMAEDARRRRDLKMVEREREEMEARRAIEEKMRSAELKQELIQGKLREQRTIEHLEKEKERRERTFSIEKRIYEHDNSRKMNAEYRIEEREGRLRRIREEAEQKQRRNHTLSLESHKNFEFKIDAAKRSFEEDQEEQRRQMFEREQHVETRRERAEAERRNRIDDKRNKSEARAAEIRRTLDENYMAEQVRKQSYLEKFIKADESKQRRDREVDHERRAKIERDYAREHKVRQTLAEKEQQDMANNEEFLEVLNNELIEAQNRKDEAIRNAKKKHITDYLKMEDVEENNRRNERRREQKRREYEEKVAADAARLQRMRIEKDRNYDDKKRIQASLDQEKIQILRDFERNKKSIISGLTSHNQSNLSIDMKASSPLAEYSSYKYLPTVKSPHKEYSLPSPPPAKVEKVKNNYSPRLDKPSVLPKATPPRQKTPEKPALPKATPPRQKTPEKPVAQKVTPPRQKTPEKPAPPRQKTPEKPVAQKVTPPRQKTPEKPKLKQPESPQKQFLIPSPERAALKPTVSEHQHKLSTPYQLSPEKLTPYQGSPEELTPIQASPENTIPIQGSPEHDIPAQKSPAKIASYRSSPEATPKHQSPSYMSSPQKTPVQLKSPELPERSEQPSPKRSPVGVKKYTISPVVITPQKSPVNSPLRRASSPETPSTGGSNGKKNLVTVMNVRREVKAITSPTMITEERSPPRNNTSYVEKVKHKVTVQKEAPERVKESPEKTKQSPEKIKQSPEKAKESPEKTKPTKKKPQVDGDYEIYGLKPSKKKGRKTTVVTKTKTKSPTDSVEDVDDGETITTIKKALQPQQPIQTRIVLLRKDTTVNDLRSAVYDKESRPLRRVQITEFMRVLDKAVKEDHEQMKMEKYMSNLLATTQNDDEAIAKLRHDRDFLLFG